MRKTPWLLSAALICSTSLNVFAASTAASKTENSKTVSLAFCASLSADADGDGTGSEKGASCKMRTGFDITAEMGVGWNLGNTLDSINSNSKSPIDETGWGNPKTTKANIQALKAAGFNTLRLPVSWDNHMSGADHTIDAAWLARVEEIANYALGLGMYVIVNIHHNNGWEMPTLANEATAKDHLSKIWPQIAERFQKYDHHLIFETMNEPRVTQDGKDDWWGKPEYLEVINRLNATALQAIRATGGNNTRRLVMLPGYAAAPNDFQLDGIVLPNDKMIALSTHAYTPYHFALNLKEGKTSVFTGEEELDQLFARLNTKFIRKGVPVIVGEWGAMNRDNQAERAKFAEYYVRGATRYGIPTVWWDNGSFSGDGENFGLLNRHKNTWPFPVLIDAMMRGAKP